MIDWYRIKSALIDEPEIRKMSRKLGIDRWGIVGRVQAFWGWCDIHASEGVSRLCREDLDELCGCDGFADAMIEVGWLAVNENDELCMVDWDKYNSDAAKERARKAQNKREQRARDKARREEEEQRVTDMSPRAVTPVSDASPMSPPNINIKGNNKNMVVASSTVCVEGAPQAPATPQLATTTAYHFPAGFLEWLVALCATHRSLRRSRTLAPDVMQAALAAFERCPDAAEDAPLLKAFLGDRLQEDSNGHTFYRPDGQARFFEKLEDTLGAAERWDREVGWSKKRGKGAQKREKAPSGACNASGGQPATYEETKAMLAEMKAELGLGKGGEA